MSVIVGISAPPTSGVWDNTPYTVDRHLTFILNAVYGTSYWEAVGDVIDFTCWGLCPF